MTFRHPSVIGLHLGIGRRLPRRGLGLLLAACLISPVHSAAAAELIFRCVDADQAKALLDHPDLLSDLSAGCRLSRALGDCRDAPRQLEAILRLSVPDEASLPAARKALAALRPIWVEEPARRWPDLVPNDPRYAELWALPIIQAPQAWDTHTGTGGIIVAVVDTGTELSHPDLAAALWTNAAEAAGTTGVDDDGNGIVDDVHGADLLDNDGDPTPAAGDYSHGTHTAGTAACVTHNGTGVACPAWRASLMPVRAGHMSSISRGVEGIWYAARAGARVINCSWGGDSFSAYEYEVIQAARELGALVVASAGNDGTERLHYPGAYDGVLCVAATTPQDTRMAGSQVGWWVDLCAPGLDILSTVIGGTYGLKSGTSMATPLAASLCALACSRYPAETGDQIRERVKAGCDNIDALNPGLAGKLGTGRLNAWRTMTQTVRAVELRDWSLLDGDADGVAEPGEVIQLRLTVEALLGSFSGLQAQCQVTTGEATVQDGVISLGTLNQGQSANPVDSFSLTLSPSLDPGQQIRVHLVFSAAGGFSQAADLLILVAPTYVDHDNSALQLSLGAYGVQGFYNWTMGQAVGSGLRWPPGSPSHLYHGSLLLAADNGQVAHAASYLNGTPSELVTLPGGEIRRTAAGNELSSEAEFSAQGLAGLRVSQHGLSLASANWMLVRFRLQNQGGTAIAGLQPGIWLDFDISGSWNNDTGGWDAGTGTAWMSQSGGPLLGACLLSDEAASYRLCRWSEWSGGAGLEDFELFGWLREGFQQTQSTGPDDWQCLLGAPVLDLPPGGEREMAVALLAGNSLAELVAAGTAARLAWQELGQDPAPERPNRLQLAIDVHPNPFNPATRWSVVLERPGELAWRVVALDGRQVTAGRRGGLPAGRHEEGLHLSGQASGLYLLEVEQGGRRAVARLLLVH